MLDKTVPNINVLMKRKAGTPVPAAVLPEGFGFCFYQEGDGRHWAEIEASVGEFKAELDAYIYFGKKFLPLEPEVKRRMLFIEDKDGKKAATGTAFWEYAGQRREPWLHWFAVRPEYQGLGLGRAIIFETLRLAAEIEGDRDFHLKTQTASHKAIRLYMEAGFEMVEDRGRGGYTFTDKLEDAVRLMKELESKRV